MHPAPVPPQFDPSVSALPIPRFQHRAFGSLFPIPRFQLRAFGPATSLESRLAVGPVFHL